MKKFISMVMAAAMVVTMVPATAFAANTATAKVVNALEVTVNEVKATSKDVSELAAAQNTALLPQLQLKVTDADALMNEDDTYEVTLKFDNFVVADNDVKAYVYRAEDGNAKLIDETALATNRDGDKVTFKFTAPAAVVQGSTEPAFDLQAGDIIAFKLDGSFKKAGVGDVATVKVSGGDFGTTEEFVFASVVEKGIKVELKDDEEIVIDTVDNDDVVVIAPEESEELDSLVIKPTAGYDFDDVLTFEAKYLYNSETGKIEADADGTAERAKMVLKASKGFEFLNNDSAANVTVTTARGTLPQSHITYSDDAITILLDADDTTGCTSIEVEDIVLEATSAKAGAEATITVTTSKLAKVGVVVAKVVDLAVIMELADADEDVPVFYNGVDADNTGLTVEDKHISLEVKIYETFKGAWSNHKDFTLSLPEGVYVVKDGVVADDVNTTFTGTTPAPVGYDYDAELVKLFKEAYVRGDYEEFNFKRGWFNETHDHDDAQEAHEITFTLELVAEPTFVGDVVLTLEGAALETQEVTIAKFVAPYTVKAEQNDVIIDYRFTEIETPIVITEAEAGLWAEGTAFAFEMEKVGTTADDYLVFEDAATVEVNAESEMEIDDEVAVNKLGFKVEEVSDEEKAEVTISGIELFMQRNIPAGPYALELNKTLTTTMKNFLAQDLLVVDGDTDIVDDIDADDFVVNPAFVNVVTAGRDQDDASFTTTVVVPVGETTIYAGDRAITLDVPAYINADGYTMLPVRAVATALGINNNAVQWDQATKTVIIMYGQRIITMTAGSSVIYVSGTAIPAKSAVEIVDGRAFLGLRDLATTLGVSEIAWDATTQVATLNPKA